MRIRTFLACSLALGACAPAALQAAPGDWTAVSPATLASLRGGFVNSSGLHLSVGIEQLLTLNGEIVARTHVDLGNFGGAAAANGVLAGTTLLQNGAGNAMLSGFSDGVKAGMVIQNTLNDQHIDSRTVISATANSAALLDTVNFHNQLNDALTRAVAPR